MKKLLLVTFVLLAALTHAQAPLQPAWVKIITPSNSVDAKAWSVTSSPEGHLYWSTNQPNFSPLIAQKLYKLDTAGNSLWTTPGIYDLHQDNKSFVVREKDGIVYTAGKSCYCIHLNQVCCDLSLVAWNAMTGDTLWSRTYDVFGEYEECDGLVIEDSSIFLTGWARDSGATWFDVLLMETDLSGNVLWQKTWDEGAGMDEKQDGHIFIDNTHIFCTGVSQVPPSPALLTSGFKGEATIWKFDRTGNYVDHKTWGYNTGSPLEFDDALGMASDGTNMFAVGAVSPGLFNSQWFIRKYDKNLNLIWQDEWGGSGGEDGRAVALGPLGNIFVAVNTFSYGNSGKIALLKYSPAGQLVAFYLYGSDSLKETAQDIIYFQDALYISGNKISATSGKQEPLLIKVDLSSLVNTGVVSGYAGFTLEQNVPNPAQAYTQIRFTLDAPGKVELEVRDIQGQLVSPPIKGRFAAGQHRIQLDLSQVAAGNYLYSLKVSDRRFTRMLNIVK
ncbi:MAG TPA: T9SS type A sorting domain-containing protein [Bacteroidetes bacterium]|nr:T9SS type A sorting domain-containing protein [Bacteroidota bacterium]